LLTTKLLLHRARRPLPLLILFPIILFGAAALPAARGATAVTQRAYIPYTSAASDLPVTDRAIFWFGEVGPTTKNYTDVRLIHNNDALYITLHIFDQYLFVDDPRTDPSLTNFDAVSVFIHRDSSPGGVPTTNSYQFVAALEDTQRNGLSRPDFETAYRGNGSTWIANSLDFASSIGIQSSNGFNNTGESDRGWNITFVIPYNTLGLSGKPVDGTSWRLALRVHDRDGLQGNMLTQTNWPEDMNSNAPNSWNELIFGMPLPYSPPPGVTIDKQITIRHGANGDSVEDGHVGGSTVCGREFHPDYWPYWGLRNYTQPGDDPSRINVQNQWNLGDWPCFSKFYITFPLDRLPANQAVGAAELTMFHFGNSDPTQAQPSLIQVLSVAEDWQDTSITWNNAPQAVMLLDRTEVTPILHHSQGKNYSWDVSQAVADAYAAGEPLRLVLYSADSALHSGKYFFSSEATKPEYQPTLTINYGDLYGFYLTPSETVKTIAPGSTGTVQIALTATGDFDSLVAGEIDNTDAAIDVSFSGSDNTKMPGELFSLELSHLNGGQTEGALYAVPLTFSGDGVARQLTIYVLVNGQQIYLPFLER
jgi:hypothetical protein